MDDSPWNGRPAADGRQGEEVGMTTVLVADDDADVRELITLKLEQAGYAVLAAADGTAALTMLHQRRPDIALLDIRMPGASGTDICRYVRDAPDLRSEEHTSE